MQRLKDLISFVVLVLLTGISLAAIGQVLRVDLPDTKTEPIDLGYWLTERDLAAESSETKARLVRKLEEDIEGQRDWSKEFKDLDDPRRRQMERNLSQLLEAWFTEKADRFASLPAADRDAYLDSELDKITQLVENRLPGTGNPSQGKPGQGKSGSRKPGPLDPGQSKSGEGKSNGLFPSAMAGLMLLNSKIEAWIDQADPSRRPSMREFHEALKSRLINRELEKALKK